MSPPPFRLSSTAARLPTSGSAASSFSEPNGSTKPRQKEKAMNALGIGHTSCVLAQRPSMGRYVKSHREPAAGLSDLALEWMMAKAQGAKILLSDGSSD